MTINAGRVVPGVLATMLFAAPALANTASDRLETNHASKSHSLTPPHNESRRASVHRHKPATKLAGVARRHQSAPHAVAATAAFVDDGFSFTEGSHGEAGWKQSGMASWYGGSRWQGHLTSSGSVYNENALTAAHATLPLGSHVRVSLHNSSRSVIVTITDRPGTHSRIIDLSRGAASALGMLDRGVAMVTLSPP